LTAGPAVIDTNVVVSGLLTGTPGSPTARILASMLEGGFRFLLSIELLAEYHDVLGRPRIRRRHGLSARQIEVVLTDIAASGAVVEAARLGDRPPGGDGHLWQILDAEPNAVLVTGDRRLFEGPGRGARVVSPRSFADRLVG
jgi:uncharacterized protein